MKKEYQKPVIFIDIMDCEGQILVESIQEVINVDGNADIEYGGGGSGPARAPQYSVWDE